MTSQSERARRFRALHHERPILVIANAWDAASARIFELAGARAVGTTSAGLAWSLGYPDGEQMDRSTLLGAVRQIVRVVDVPVTVDFVAGYGDTPAAVSDSVDALIDAGAVGMNIEDKLEEPAVLAQKIGAIRELTSRRNVTFFVNARADTFLRPFDDAKRVADAIRRLSAYEEAGADGLFAPGVRKPDDIAALVAAVHRPLNVMAAPGVPSVPELEKLGVARVSVGAGPSSASMGYTRRMAEEFLGRGTYDFMADALPYGEINKMFAAS